MLIQNSSENSYKNLTAPNRPFNIPYECRQVFNVERSWGATAIDLRTESSNFRRDQMGHEDWYISTLLEIDTMVFSYLGNKSMTNLSIKYLDGNTQSKPILRLSIKRGLLFYTGLLAWIWLTANMSVYAQSKSVTTLGPKEGLEFEYIESMIKDSLGMVWISGYNSGGQSFHRSNNEIRLQRYNGINFSPHTIPLAGNIVHFYHLESDGTFACLLHNRQNKQQFELIKFNPYDYSWERIIINSESNDNDNLSGLVPHENNYLILSRQNDSLYIHLLDRQLSPKKKTFLNNKANTHLGGNQMIIPFDDHFLIYEGNYGVLAYTWEGTFIRAFENAYFNFNSKNEVGVARIHEQYGMGPQAIYSVRGTLTETKYFTYHTKRKSFELVEAKNNFIIQNQLSNPVETSTYFAGNHIIVNDNHLDSSFISIYHGSKILTRIYSNEISKISSIYSRNPREEIYVGSSNGLHIIDMKTSPVRTALQNKSIRSIHYLSPTEVIVACENAGWYLLDPTSLHSQSLALTYSNKPFLATQTRAIFGSEKIIWSNYDEGILKLDLHTKQVVPYRHYPIKCMLDGGDYIIYGTIDYALMRFDKRTGDQIQLLEMNDNDTEDLLFNHDSSTVVMATKNGLMEYNFRTSHATKHGLEDVEGNHTPICLTRLNDSIILVGTSIGIVYSFNETNSTLDVLYEDKLKSPIATILCDKNAFWFNTYDGIVKYTLGEGALIRYSTEKGLVHNECNRHSATSMPNGDLYIGGLGGLNIISPDKELTSNNIELRLVFAEYYDKKAKGLKVINSPVALDNMDHEIILPPSKRFLNLEFGTTKYIQNNEYAFEYKLNKNSSWEKLNYFNKLQFPDLSPGNYDLQVRIINSLGEEVGKRLFYKIHVKNFFYKEWWFYLLGLLGAIALSFYFIRRAKMEQTRQKQFSQQLIAIQESELKRISREIHDAAGQNLVLLKLKAKAAEDDEMQNLVDATLGGIREISHNMHPFVLEKFGLTVALQRIIRLLDERSDLFITQHVDNIDALFSKEHSLHIYRIVQESLTNIMKHAQAKSVRISILNKADEVTITIRDNGIGFQNSKTPSTQIGLRTIRERVDIIGGSINIQSTINEGTTIAIRVPRDSSHSGI